MNALGPAMGVLYSRLLARTGTNVSPECRDESQPHPSGQGVHREAYVMIAP